MVKTRILEDFLPDIERCVKCGACRAHCPVFGAAPREGRVARGKITMAKALIEGNLSLTSQVVDDISQCLLCGSCFVQCPNHVPTQDIVAAVRERISSNKKLPGFDTLVSAVLERPGIMDSMARAGHRLSSILGEKIPEQSGLRLRFPGMSAFENRTIPTPAALPFRDQFPEVIPGHPEQPVLGFFTGCGTNYLYPVIGRALIRICQFLGVTVVIPRDQACCGLPAVSAGRKDTLSVLAEKNQQAFSRHKVDYIVTACASCHEGIHRLYGQMDGDEVVAFSQKTIDIMTFLVKQNLPEKLKEMPCNVEPVKVTWHDPCHLRSQNVTKEPRQLLQALSCVEFVEMENAGTCCGLGGTYSVHHYDISKKIGEKKAVSIENSHAALVATACPGCMIQLQDSLNHQGMSQRVVHILELIAGVIENVETVQGKRPAINGHHFP